MIEYKCKFCNQTFNFEKKQQAGAHVTNCSMNPNKKNMIEKSLKTKNQIKNEKILNCLKCGKEYKIYVTEHIYSIGDYTKHCSYKCSNSREWNDEQKENISKKLKEYNVLNPRELIREERECLNCNKPFKCEPSSPQKYCSLSCTGSIGGRNSKQGKRSKNEILFFELCENEFKNVISNENIFNGWDADIILNDLKIAVLWNGKWHYEQIGKNHSLKQVQNRDKIKLNEITKMGFEPYIIKDMGKYNPEFVKNEFIVFKNYIMKKQYDMH
jgi:hypothetical protein